MLEATHLSGFGIRPAPKLSYIGSNSSSTDATTYDFSTFTIPSNGLMIVGAAGRGGSTTTVSSVSIGGTNGTIHVNPSGNSNPSCIASRLVGAGSVNVTVTFGAGVSRAGCFVWLVTNPNLLTPYASDGTNDGTAASSVTATFNIPPNGFAVYVALHSDAGTDATWSSATERAEVTAELKFTGADKSVTSAISSHAETASWGTSQNRAISGASWN